MGCYTVYVVRGGGSLIALGDRYGQEEFASPDELRAFAAREQHRDRWVPTTEIDRTWCSGWFVDTDARFARTYRCRTRRSSACELDRELRAAPGWTGWDLGVAWERAVDISVLAGLAVVRDDHLARLDGWVGCTEAGLFTAHPNPAYFPHRWDAAANRLEFDNYDERPATAIATIDARGRVHDYGFEDNVLFELLGRGPEILETLRANAPCPAPYGAETGALIDEVEHAIHVWLDEQVAPTTYAELRRRWPGWTIERERADFDGFLERTQRAPADAARHHALPPRAFVFVEEIWDQPIEQPPIAADEARLLAAIAADPEADAPRMVYADLLLAKGNPRGQFIHLGIELARLPEHSPRRRELAAQSRKLQQMYVRDSVGASVLEYRRGFIARVQSRDVTEVIERKILDVIPTLEDLNMWAPLDVAAVRALRDVPGIARLHGLEIHPAAGALAELGRVPALANLRRLAVRTSDAAIARELGELLATSPFAQLEHLALDGHGFDDTGVAAVTRALPACTTSLALREHRFGDPGALAVAQCAALAHLRRLAFGWLPETVAIALAQSPHLTNLRAWSQESPTDGVAVLTHLPVLRELSILYNGLSAEYTTRLAAMPQLARIERLAFRELDQYAADALAASPYLDALVELRVVTFGNDSAYAVLRDRLGDRLAIGPY